MLAPGTVAETDAAGVLPELSRNRGEVGFRDSANVAFQDARVACHTRQRTRRARYPPSTGPPVVADAGAVSASLSSS